MAYTLPRDHPRHPGPVVWHLTLILLMVTITTRFADSCSPTSDLSPQTLYNMSDTVVSGRIDRALTGSDGILTLRVRVYCQFKGDAVTSQFLSVSVMGTYQGLCANLDIRSRKKYILWLRKSGDTYSHLPADPVSLTASNIDKVTENCGDDLRIISDLKTFPHRDLCKARWSTRCQGYKKKTVKSARVPSDRNVYKVNQLDNVDNVYKVDKADTMAELNNEVAVEARIRESKSCGQLLAPPTSWLTLTCVLTLAVAVASRL